MARKTGDHDIYRENSARTFCDLPSDHPFRHAKLLLSHLRVCSKLIRQGLVPRPLQSSQINNMASYRPFEAPSAGYPAPGGLNKSTSFSDKDKQEFIVRAQKLNTLLEQLTMNNGGPSKNSFKVRTKTPIDPCVPSVSRPGWYCLLSLQDKYPAG